MLKKHSLPIAQKELHIKGAHLAVGQNFNFYVKGALFAFASKFLIIFYWLI